jgi:hypothetical protein
MMIISIIEGGGVLQPLIMLFECMHLLLLLLIITPKHMHFIIVVS